MMNFRFALPFMTAIPLFPHYTCNKGSVVKWMPALEWPLATALMYDTCDIGSFKDAVPCRLVGASGW